MLEKHTQKYYKACFNSVQLILEEGAGKRHQLGLLASPPLIIVTSAGQGQKVSRTTPQQNTHDIWKSRLDNRKCLVQCMLSERG